MKSSASSKCWRSKADFSGATPTQTYYTCQIVNISWPFCSAQFNQCLFLVMHAWPFGVCVCVCVYRHLSSIIFHENLRKNDVPFQTQKMVSILLHIMFPFWISLKLLLCIRTCFIVLPTHYPDKRKAPEPALHTDGHTANRLHLFFPIYRPQYSYLV